MTVCPPSTQPISMGEGRQRDSSASQRAAVCLHPPRAPVALILHSKSDALVVLPVTWAGRQLPKKVGFTRNRTRTTTKSYPFPLPKKQPEATGNDSGSFRCAEKKEGKIRPAGTISREVMRVVTRDDARPVRRPSQGSHACRMPTIGEKQLAPGRIPHLYGAIVASRDDASAIGRPCHCIHGSCMSAVLHEQTARPRVPYLHRVVIAPRGEACAIGRPRH